MIKAKATAKGMLVTALVIKWQDTKDVKLKTKLISEVYENIKGYLFKFIKVVPFEERKDYEQESYLYLYEAMQKFDRNRGLQFNSHYIWYCRKMLTEFTRKLATVKGKTQTTVSGNLELKTNVTSLNKKINDHSREHWIDTLCVKGNQNYEFSICKLLEGRIKPIYIERMKHYLDSQEYYGVTNSNTAMHGNAYVKGKIGISRERLRQCKELWEDKLKFILRDDLKLVGVR